MESIKGKNALITGASRGIGKAVAVSLAENGVNVCINYKVRIKEAEEVRKEAETRGVKAICLQADVSNSASVTNLVLQTRQKLGNIDILVNNAGIFHKDELENITEADWDHILNTNLKSAFLVTQECLKGMKEKGWGRIINISSIAAQTGGVTGPLYVASKAGMIGLTHSYASLLVKNGITSNAIAPALIETDMVTRDLKIEFSPTPVGRFGLPDEVAGTVILLAKNAYITGQTINVNGGWYFSS